MADFKHRQSRRRVEAIRVVSGNAIIGGVRQDGKDLEVARGDWLLTDYLTGDMAAFTDAEFREAYQPCGPEGQAQLERELPPEGEL